MIYSNIDLVEKCERIYESEKKSKRDFISKVELLKRHELSSVRYKMMGSEKAKKLRAEALSYDLRRWV